MDEKVYRCIRCGRKISKEEYETYEGMCEECHETEVDELDYEDDYQHGVEEGKQASSVEKLLIVSDECLENGLCQQII